MRFARDSAIAETPWRIRAGSTLGEHRGNLNALVCVWERLPVNRARSTRLKRRARLNHFTNVVVTSESRLEHSSENKQTQSTKIGLKRKPKIAPSRVENCDGVASIESFYGRFLGSIAPFTGRPALARSWRLTLRVAFTGYGLRLIRNAQSFPSPSCTSLYIIRVELSEGVTRGSTLAGDQYTSGQAT